MKFLSNPAARAFSCPGALALVLIFATPSLLAATQADSSATRSGAPLAVLDIELIGDLGGEEFAAAHEARLKMASAHLRKTLAESHLFEVVDNRPAQPMIDQLTSLQFLHKCNGCEFDIARRLNAEQVLVAWVHRVSNLILTLNYEIRDVESGATVQRSSFSFRGDNDAAWKRAIELMVKEMEDG